MHRRNAGSGLTSCISKAHAAQWECIGIVCKESCSGQIECNNGSNVAPEGEGVKPLKSLHMNQPFGIADLFIT